MTALSEIDVLEQILRDEDRAAARLMRESGRHFKRAAQIQRELDSIRRSRSNGPSPESPLSIVGATELRA